MTRPGARPLRVCHVAYTFYENDNRVMRYAEALIERGAAVDVIVLRRSGQDRSAHLNGVRIHRIQRRRISERGAFAYLLKILWFFSKSMLLLGVLHARRRYDVVHVHNVPDFLVFAAWLPKASGARVILDIHDILPELYAGKFGTAEQSRLFRALLFVERFSCRYADHVIVANHLWHRKLISRAVTPAKCTTIMNYPDLSIFKPAVSGAKRQDGKFVFLYPGTLNHHQGVDLAVEAFAIAADRMAGAELHIYGEGPARRGLEDLVRRRGLEARVKLMDRVPLTSVPGVMASANVGVVPKRAEGFGNEAFSTKILEFMACGVPVVVSRTHIDSHYFTPEVVRFFRPGDATDLSSALLWAYEHRTEHDGWIRAARAYAVRNSWQQRVVDYEALIDGLLPPAAGAPVVAG